MEMVWLSDSRCCTGSRSFTSRFKSHSLGSDLPPFPCGRIMVGLVLGCSHQPVRGGDKNENPLYVYMYVIVKLDPQ